MANPQNASSYTANGPGGPDGAGFFTSSGGVDKGVVAAGVSVGVIGSSGGGTGLIGICGGGTGVFGTSGNGRGVDGHSDTAYGGYFSCGKGDDPGLAQLRLEPSAVLVGSPDIGNHQTGEFFVDQNGTLFYCIAGGTPGKWKQVQLV